MKLGILSTYVPRECGIATYAKDVLSGIHAADAGVEGIICAISDRSYKYPKEVRRELRQSIRSDYIEVADWFNASTVDAVLIQHEFGIFGGFNGAYLRDFLKRLKKPAIITLHTVSMHPKARRRASRLRLMRELLSYVDGITVTIPSAIAFYKSAGFPAAITRRMTVIPHGAPRIPTSIVNRRTAIRRKLGFAETDTVVMTYGLISERKGIHYALRAMKELVVRYPHLQYLIAGRMHPSRSAKYYRTLQEYVKRHGLEKNVHFEDRYLHGAEVLELLVAADIYLVPYLTKEQVSSGTLAYAVAAGKAIISTRFAYAQDTLADGRGLLIDFASKQEIVHALQTLIQKPKLRDALGRRAAQFGRRLAWDKVGGQYIQVLETAMKEKK